MGPISYAIGGPDPSQMLLQGLGQGLQINQMQQAQQAAQQQALAQRQMNAELEQAARSGRVADIQRVMIRYPHLADKLKFGAEIASAEETKGRVSFLGELVSAFGSDDPKFAMQVLERRRDLLRNQGDNEGAGVVEQVMADAEADRLGTRTMLGLRLAALPGGKDVLEAIGKAEEEKRKTKAAPFEQRKVEAGARESEATATTAEVTAKYADSQALKDLELKGWNIEGIKSDIEFKRQSARIAAMQAQYAREGNDLRREELRMKLDEARRARESSVREKAADLDSARTTTDTLLNTVERLLKTPPSTVRAALGPIDSRLPTIQQDVADFEETLATLGSQIFLSNAEKMRGLGSLTQAEGTRLEVALGSLSQRQSPESFNANMAEIRRLTLKARKNLTDRYGAPETTPDTPAAPGARPPLDSFFK